MARPFRLDSNTMVIPSQNGAMIGCNRSRQHLKSTGFLHKRTGCRACGVRVQCIQSSPLPHAVAAWQPTARVMCPFMCPLHIALLLGKPRAHAPPSREIMAFLPSRAYFQPKLRDLCMTLGGCFERIRLKGMSFADDRWRTMI